MLEYIEEHAQKMIRKIPFVPLISEVHYRWSHRTDGQHILDTLPGHPNYVSYLFNTPIECRVMGASVRVQGKTGRYPGHPRRLQISLQEVRYLDRLRSEQAILLDHMGAEAEIEKLPERSKKAFAAPLATVIGYEHTEQTREDIKRLSPEVVTLGPLQLEPPPPHPTGDAVAPLFLSQ